MRCPVCHCPNVDDAVQCGRCGATLRPAASGGRNSRHPHLRDVEESAWLKVSLIVVAAVLAALALGGAWWRLMHSGETDARDEPMTVQSDAAPSSALPPSAQTMPAPTAQAASDVMAATLPALPSEAASAPNADAVDGAQVASSAMAPDLASQPVTAAEATAALTRQATALEAPPSATRPDSRMPAEAVAGYIDSSGRDIRAEGRGPAGVPPDYLAAPATQPAPRVPPATAMAPRPAQAAANSVASRLAACDRYAWYQVVQHERCLWSVCDGRWGKDGCPSYPRNRPSTQ